MTRTCALYALPAALCGCGAGAWQPTTPPGVAMGTMAVTSTSFATNGPIPVDNTCDGLDKSPQLTWSAPPSATKGLAILMEDPDAPGGTFTHWVAVDLRPDTLTLSEGADPATAAGGIDGTNDAMRSGYSGPCPPRLEIHHYVFRVFALDARIGPRGAESRGAFEQALGGHVLAQGAVVGTFSH
ncbi:MAG TPA: YbhB/YbcL family Raf kinase inhibitor-like protein [Polyangiaceae bacterium]|nr:YbhB/YbcL family Raf kinase inhibitor-like protein [Polyangiaceae bacterium]